MTLTRISDGTCHAAGTTASAYTKALGVAANAGDVLIVCGHSNGTHAANGMIVSDSVNNVNFTTILEQDESNASSHWLQAFVYQTPVALASGTTITFTPYAANTASTFSLDVFRGATTTVDTGPSGASPAAGTTSLTNALSPVPKASSLVLSFATFSGGTLTAGSPITLGTSDASAGPTAVGYVLGADGTTNYQSTWTSTVSNSNANVVVAYLPAAGDTGPATFLWSRPRLGPTPFGAGPKPQEYAGPVPPASTSSALVIAPPFVAVPIPPVSITSSQPLGNPAVGTPAATVVGSPAYTLIPVPPVSITASQPLGNPAVPTPQLLVVGPPYVPVPIPPVSITASQPLGNPAVGTPRALVVGTPYTLIPVPGAVISSTPLAPPVSTVATPQPLVVSTPYVARPVPGAAITASQPLGNPAVGTPTALVVTIPYTPVPVPGAQLFVNPAAPVVGATTTPGPLVVSPAGLSITIARPVITSSLPLGNPATGTPGPLVVGVPYTLIPVPKTYFSASQPLGRPAVGSPQPIVVTPTHRWTQLPVPVLVGGGGFPCTTTRPSGGITPDTTGHTSRPTSGTTAEALGNTARPFTGITKDECH